MLDHHLFHENGFLKNPADWSEAMGTALAEKQGLQLTEAHWKVLRFARDFFQRYSYTPIQRLIVKDLQKTDANASSLRLQQLFPEGPRQICLIAGLPKPARCV